MLVTPIPLVGEGVRLDPLVREDAPVIATVLVPETFRYFVSIQPRSYDLEGIRDFVDQLLEAPGTLAFVVRSRTDGSVLGMSCYLDIRSDHRALEIGMTWYIEAVRGTRVNPECKLLLLGHAFEDLGAVRVTLKTDLRNEHSQAAIAKLGAVKEGVLRKHGIQPNGYVRDTVFYSVLDEEWPKVREGLLARLGR